MIPNEVLNSNLTFDTSVEDCSLCENYKICKYSEEVTKLRKKLKGLSELNCPDCVTLSVSCKYARSSYNSLKITYSNKSANTTGSPLIRDYVEDRVY